MAHDAETVRSVACIITEQERRSSCTVISRAGLRAPGIPGTVEVARFDQRDLRVVESLVTVAS